MTEILCPFCKKPMVESTTKRVGLFLLGRFKQTREWFNILLCECGYMAWFLSNEQEKRMSSKSDNMRD